ncbi:hypothetical protein LTR86_003809 [Recurvomyces mirabilis]|nr:hypothetical protein LTR86_003809 [Recurvomyces mirabilis]
MDIALNALNPMRRTPFTRLPSTGPAHDGHPVEADSVPIQRERMIGGEDDLELKGLGLEDSKAVWHPLDVMALSLSLLCCAAAVAVIQSDAIAWRLGTKQQLTVVGLMISIMNLCLGYVAPLWEIRHGQSTLQNLDGLLRKTGFGPQMDLGWRTVLFAFTFLPLGLSLAYKQFFNGGASTVLVGERTTTWGMYPPPGLTASHGLVGTTLMYNATLPFLQATWNWHVNQTPSFPAAFGYDTLVLGQTATAMLDTPKSSTVKQWQKGLDLGETRNVTANVYAVLAQHNDTIDEHRNETFYRTSTNTQVGSEFWKTYANISRLVTADTYAGWVVGMLGNWDVISNKDQSWLFLGVCPTPKGGTPNNLTTFIPYANM